MHAWVTQKPVPMEYFRSLDQIEFNLFAFYESKSD